MKNLATLFIRLENNLEIARTSRDTGKTPLINYVIGNNIKKEEIFEKKQESLEYTGKLSHVVNHCDIRKAVSYKSVYKCERKKVCFRKQFSKFWALDNSELQME